jgi:hypothetical protein
VLRLHLLQATGLVLRRCQWSPILAFPGAEPGDDNRIAETELFHHIVNVNELFHHTLNKLEQFDRNF